MRGRTASEQLTLQWNGRTIPARWQRSQRRSVQLQLEPPGLVCCRTPLHVTRAGALRALEDKKEWILAGLEQFAQLGVAPHTYRSGDVFWFAGEQLTLRVLEGKGPYYTVEATDSELQVTAADTNPAQIKAMLETWYRQMARQWLTTWVNYHSRCLALEPKGITITGARKRWGSCSEQGRLSFSWLLVMAPPLVMEYVVVHELCHMRIMDHSPKFWKLVADALPGWQEQRDWLSRHGLRFFWN